MIDWKRIRELYEEVGAEDFDEIIELFLTEVEDVIAKIRDAKDRNSLGDDLHFLKGSSVTLGFEQLSGLCNAGEDAAENGDADTVDVDQILRSYAESKQVFLAEVTAKLVA